MPPVTEGGPKVQAACCRAVTGAATPTCPRTRRTASPVSPARSPVSFLSGPCSGKTCGRARSVLQAPHPVHPRRTPASAPKGTPCAHVPRRRDGPRGACGGAVGSRGPGAADDRAKQSRATPAAASRPRAGGRREPRPGDAVTARGGGRGRARGGRGRTRTPGGRRARSAEESRLRRRSRQARPRPPPARRTSLAPPPGARGPITAPRT